MNTRHRAPSKKATQALELISKGMSKRQAMIKAGYAKSSADNPKKNLMTLTTILTALDRMKLTLENRGITDVYLAEQLAKFAQSDNAKEFFSAYDRITKIVGIEPTKEKEVTRTLSFTEFITGDTQTKITEQTTP